MPRGSHACRFGARLAVGVAVGLSFVARVAAVDAAKEEFFERKIRPVLVEACFSCHSAEAKSLKGELRLDSREGMLSGGDLGAAVVPGDAEKSPLLRAIAYADPDLQMPPKTRLPEAVVQDFRTWIQEGAVWAWSPDAGASKAKEAAPGAPVETAGRPGFDVARRRAQHWAWSRVVSPPVPTAEDARWAGSEVDRFIAARWRAEGLRPGPRADRETRLRRLSFALTGLPPQPDAWEDFLRAEDTPSSWGRAVDRLLASPHFGERWGRHWLDKVRYAETMGHEFDFPILGAWRFRDYVIRAFNDDLSYDQFTREQIAGDALPGPRRRAPDGTDEGLVATMQYWLCQQVHSPVDVRAQQAETVDNQIDVVTKSFVGLTVACARCHDHKFDAISARDYYALYGILASSRYAISAADDPAPRRASASALRQLRDELRVAAAAALRALGPSDVPAAPAASGAVALRAVDRRMAADRWYRNGDAFASEVDGAGAGQPVWLGEKGVRVVRPGWQDGGSVSRRFQGALSSESFEITAPFLHVRAAGRGSRLAVVVEGFTLIQAPIYGDLRRGLKNEQPHWVTFDLAMWKGRRAWFEVLDWAAADPATPLPGEFLVADGWAAVGDLIFSEERTAPEVETGVSPGDWRSVVDQWERHPAHLTVAEVAWIEAGLRAVAFVPAAGWQRAWSEAESRLSEPVLVASMVEGTGWDEPIFIRGNHRRAGAVVKRRFLEALDTAASDAETAEGTGRVALADAVASADNPLFARVMVNWVWSHLFGSGLVASVDNFGVLGEAPSHPELLDWLSDAFRRDGWSVKRLIKRLVTSETWQLASRITDEDAERRDPGNRMLHRASLRRLEGEALRDALLTLGGNLDPRVGGPPVAVHLTPFMEGRGRPKDSGPMDGQGRRSVYLEVRRNFLSPWMLSFDMPAPATTVGRRVPSNVPAQALALMNDPLVHAQARRWATRVVEGQGDDSARVDRLFREAFFRRPTEEERREALTFVTAARSPVEGVVRAGEELEAWTDLCHALLNSKGFVFVE